MSEKGDGHGSKSDKSRPRTSPLYQQQQPTPSPPLNEQSPQLQPGSAGTAGEQPSTSRAPPLHLSGMRSAQSLAEWQLQAVLFRARLTQYFEVFISQGGDDIDQIMQCDETEFLEIMSLVGMASKPLHVRRLQRTLNEFSLNRAQFLVSTVPFIGLPPIDFPSTSSSDNLSAALQFLVPGYLPSASLDLSALAQQSQPPSDFLFPYAAGPSGASPLNIGHGQAAALPAAVTSSLLAAAHQKVPSSVTASATAIALPLADQFLLSLVQPQHQQLQQIPTICHAGKRARLSFSPPTTPTTIREAKAEAEHSASSIEQQQQQSASPSCSSPVAERLTDAEIARIAQLAKELVGTLPAKLEPRQGHSKRRLERGLLEAIALPVEDPLRAEHFRLFSRIYGRFDAKRRPDKALTRHERIVNEAAAQLSLLRPDLLARRDELFPQLARLFELPPGAILQAACQEPASPERSCSGASSTAESAVETPKGRELLEVEAEGEEEGQQRKTAE